MCSTPAASSGPTNYWYLSSALHPQARRYNIIIIIITTTAAIRTPELLLLYCYRVGRGEKGAGRRRETCAAEGRRKERAGFIARANCDFAAVQRPDRFSSADFVLFFFRNLISNTFYGRIKWESNAIFPVRVSKIGRYKRRRTDFSTRWLSTYTQQNITATKLARLPMSSWYRPNRLLLNTIFHFFFRFVNFIVFVYHNISSGNFDFVCIDNYSQMKQKQLKES